MDDRSLRSFDTLPAEVQRLLSQRGPLDAGQANLLSVYLAQNAATLDPQLATMIGAKIGSAPTDWRAEVSTLPSAPSPSVADRVSQVIGAVPGVGGLAGTLGTMAGESGWGPDPVGAVLPNVPGLSDTGRAILSGQEIPATGPPTTAPPTTAPLTTGPGDDLAAEPLPNTGGPRVDPTAGTITPPQDWTGSLDPANSRRRERTRCPTGVGATTVAANVAAVVEEPTGAMRPRSSADGSRGSRPSPGSKPGCCPRWRPTRRWRPDCSPARAVAVIGPAN